MTESGSPTSPRIYIGTERNQYVTQRVLEYSIFKNSSRLVETIPVFQKEARVGGTNFGFVRFMIPSITKFHGKAVYIDADQVVLDDIRKLFEELPPAYSVGLVRKPVGNFGGKAISEANQTSVMVLNCEKLGEWRIPDIFERVVPNRSEAREDQIHYRDFMSLTWIDQDLIFPISPAWNHFNVVQPDTKIVHFSHVRSQPWTNPKHELSDWWNSWLVETVQSGFLSRTRLWYEIQRGHVDRQFLLRRK